MKFDRSAPGRGVEVECRLENGKALLKWRFHLTDEYSRTEVSWPQALEAQVPRPQTLQAEVSRPQALQAEVSRLQTLQVEVSRPQTLQAQVSQSQVRQLPFRCGETSRGQDGQAWSQPVICISLMAGEGNVAAEGIQTVGEEEPLETVLVQPHLWQGRKDPFLYEAEAVLLMEDGCLDRLRTQLCLRRLEAGAEGEVLLNGQPLEIRAVVYSLPDAGSEAERQSLAIADFRQLARLGANSVCLDKESRPSFLLGLCDRFGFLALEESVAEGTEPSEGGKGTDFSGGEEGACFFVCTWNRAVKIPWKGEDAGERPPAYRDGSEALFLPYKKCPESVYYKYKAKWSKEPFVYLVPESVRRMKSGSYAVTCYSSCSRVALYTDGELFEFRKGDGIFVFQEIPARTPCIMLSAEGDGCSGALSVHKSFVKALEENN